MLLWITIHSIAKTPRVYLLEDELDSYLKRFEEGYEEAISNPDVRIIKISGKIV